MTTRELLYVKTVVDEKSISKAAQKLYVTQPSLSYCILKLEEKLGTKLFNRTSNGLVLTYAGEQYYEMAAQVLKMYSDLEVEINDINSMEKGRVTMGITHFLATYLMPAVIPGFYKRYPHIEINMVEKISSEMEKDLIDGKMDFALMHSTEGSFIEEKEYIRFTTLSKEPFLLATIRDTPYKAYAVPNPSSKYPMLHLKDIKDEPFFLVKKGQRIREVSDRILKKAHIEPYIYMETNSYETARRLASVSGGFAFVPEQYLDIFGDVYQAAYFSVDEALEPYWTLVIASSENRYLSVAARAFIKELKMAAATITL